MAGYRGINRLRPRQKPRDPRRTSNCGHPLLHWSCPVHRLLLLIDVAQQALQLAQPFDVESRVEVDAVPA